MTSKTKVFWLEHLRLLALSGLSLAQYAQREQISSRSLYNYRHLAKREADGLPARVKANRTNSFVQVRVSEPVVPVVAFHCTLILNSGHRLDMNRLPDAQWLLSLSTHVSGVR
jgi:hypothetical protein